MSLPPSEPLLGLTRPGGYSLLSGAPCCGRESSSSSRALGDINSGHATRRIGSSREESEGCLLSEESPRETPGFRAPW